MKYKSHLCQKCGAEIGWLGRFIEFVMPFWPMRHKCSRWHDATLVRFYDGRFLHTSGTCGEPREVQWSGPSDSWGPLFDPGKDAK